MGEGGPKSIDERREETGGEPIYLMEVGRYKERMKEAVHLLPLMLRQSIQFFIIAFKTLGTPREKIEVEIQAMVKEAFDKAEALRKKADGRFEANAQAVRAKNR